MIETIAYLVFLTILALVIKPLFEWVGNQNRCVKVIAEKVKSIQQEIDEDSLSIEIDECVNKYNSRWSIREFDAYRAILESISESGNTTQEIETPTPQPMAFKPQKGQLWKKQNLVT